MGSDQSQFAQPVNENELIQDEVVEVDQVIEKSEIPHFNEEQKCKKKNIWQCLASTYS